MARTRFRRGAWVEWCDALGRDRGKRSAAEHEARLHEISKALAVERGISRAGGHVLTVGHYVSFWLEEVKTRSSPRTWARYASVWRTHLTELDPQPIAEVTRFQLKQLLLNLHKNNVGLAQVIKVLSMVFGTAHYDGLIPVNPAQRLKKVFGVGQYARDRSGLEPKAMSEYELTRFVRALVEEPIYESLFRTMVFSGLRVGEARALQVRDVNLVNQTLHVRRTFSTNVLADSTKTGKDRYVEIPESLASEFEGLLRFRSEAVSPEAWVFHKRERFLRVAAVRLAFKRALKRAGLRTSFTPHCLRHTYASLMIQKGARSEYVQRQLGHHSISLTVDLYGRGAILTDRKTLNRLVSDAEKEGNPTSARDDESTADPLDELLSHSLFSDEDDSDPDDV